MASSHKGRIVEVQKVVHRTSHCVTGISQKDQSMYNKLPGGNGTYVIDFEYHGTTVDISIFIYDYKEVVTWDIREFILAQNNAKKISKKLLDYVIEKNDGLKVTVECDGNEGFEIDFNQLDVVPPKQKKRK